MAVDMEGEKTDRVVLDSDGCSRELAIACSPPYPNALIVGPPNTARRTLAILLPRLKLPVVHWHVGSNIKRFPPDSGTLVIWNVERLNAAHQRWLLDARQPYSAAQIIAVAATDLFERVECGEFLDTLYYRLNVVLIRA